MKKNVSSQEIGVQAITAADGTDFTDPVTVYVTGDAGTQALGGTASGVCTHEGNGYHTYVPTQAETNYDLIAFTFTGSGMITATVQVFTIDAISTDVWAEGTRTLTAATNITSDASAINVTSGVVDNVTLVATTTTNTDMLTAAAVNAEVDTALTDIKLDHLVAVADADDVVDNSIIAKLANSGATADWSAYVNTTDSLMAIRDHVGNGANLTEAGGDGDHLTAINLPNQIMDITGNITGNLSGSVGSVTGAVGSVTGAVASVTAEVSADVTKISGTAAAADNLEASMLTNAIITGTAATGTLSTTACTSSLTGYADDQLIGRVIIFTSGDAAGEATDITDYASASGLLTFTALTTAPANSDTFVIV